MSTDSTNVPPSEAASLSDLAQQRRVIAEQESIRPRPKWVQSVEQSEILYTFDPAGLPYREMDVSAFSDRLHGLYGVELSAPDYSPLLGELSRDRIASMDESALLQRLTEATTSFLKWKGGRFPLRDDYVPIRSIRLNRESVHVSVSGVSQVAEVIATEVVEELWSLVGTKRKFADLQELLQLRAYGTSTRLALPFGPESLLNPAVWEFLDANLSKGKRYAASMGRVKVGQAASSEVSAVASLDDLTIHVSRFSPSSGYAETSDLVFSVTAQSDYRTGRLKVSSQLPYDEHVELITSLFGVTQT